mmetsp:Transcript_16949/g.23716  ORF Transcript_16949/g.23716 Transcript_16949/m.23716 type:complete len:148 (-) Transcript_16949:653-1096(-)
MDADNYFEQLLMYRVVQKLMTKLLDITADTNQRKLRDSGAITPPKETTRLQKQQNAMHDRILLRAHYVDFFAVSTNLEIFPRSLTPLLFSTPPHTSTPIGLADLIAFATFSGSSPPARKKGYSSPNLDASFQSNVFPVPPPLESNIR